MIRVLYQLLLALHPDGFRNRFGEEMLWLFDESVAEGRVASAFGDGLVSVARQWACRSGLWKVAVGAAVALLEIVLVFLAFTPHPH